MTKSASTRILRIACLLSSLALCLGVLPAAAATDNAWTGSGPFATGQSNRTIGALAVSPDGATVYAGTGSGTVIAYLATKPSATTLAATNLTRTSATLTGTVDAKNADTAAVFEYGPTTAYGLSAAATPSIVTGTTGTAVTADLTGLTPGSTVHYRVRAGNVSGVSYGDDMSFTLDGISPAAAITYAPAGPYKQGTSVTITATFSEPMAAIPAPQISVSGSDTLAAADMNRTDSTHYTYAYTAGAGNGTAAIALSAGMDLAGNIVSAAPTSGGTFELDNTPPALTATAADSTHVDVTFSEAVTNATTTANYTINNGATVSAAADQGGHTCRLATSPLSIGTTYTITVNSSQVKDLAGNILSMNTATFSRISASDTAPTPPTLSSPADRSEVVVTTPTFTVNASFDADGDPVTYAYEVYADSGMSNLVASTAGAGTSWTVTPALSDNTPYWWRARATDGITSSNWMSTARFFVNTANDPPAAPGISSPADSGVVSSLTPTLTVTNATDPDRDSLTYEFEVYANSNFTGLAASATGISQGSGGTTSWSVSPALTDNRTYWWKSRAVDEHGLAGAGVSGSFSANTSNHAPGVPALSSPASGSEGTDATPDLSAVNSTDADGDTLFYVFEIDTVNTFDSGSRQTSGLVAEGGGTTAWTPAALSDNTTYYWRVKANDGNTDSEWMPTASYFVNTANDAPGVPTVLTPADGSNVTVLGPTLSVNAATDVDNDGITYDFSVYSDSGLTSLVTSTTGAGTSWVVTPPLTDKATYWWKARAFDQHGLAGNWMAGSSFFTDNTGANVAPTITITKPGATEPVTTGSSYTITWTDSDPDSNAAITLGYDTLGTGCSGTVIASGISEDDPANSYTWDISGLAEGSYYVYAAIDDGTSSVCSYAVGPLRRIRRSGDLNGDGTVNSADALKALRIAAGIDTATADDLIRGDVAPFVNGHSQPDGAIGIGDVVVILRKVVGLANW